jgi:small-conductance mechanosensitive channel
MTRSLIALMGICTLVLTSCMDLETSKQLEQISAMNQTLDSIETVFQEHKIDTIAKLSLNAYNIENRIKKNYVSDTVNMEFARKMDAFKVMRNNFAPIGKSQTIIPSSIKEEREKLVALKTDIENGNGKREAYAEHVAFEQNKVSQLRSLLNEYVEKKEKSLQTYINLSDELNEFSLSLLEK